VGVLLVLLILPGGLGDLVYRLRDGWLRWVAARRGIIVPSLLADIAPPGDDPDPDVVEHAEQAVEAAVEAAAGAIVAESGSGGPAPEAAPGEPAPEAVPAP
jgi:hypothetical protein